MHDIRILRIGIEFNSAIRYTLDGSHSNNFASSASPGQCYCVDCIQHNDSSKQKNEKRFHCWAAVGYDLKLDITFYEVLENTNEKMSLQVYINQILELVVKPWLLEKQDFVLEEDGDRGHGKAKNCNIVRQ